MLALTTHPADIQDRDGGPDVIAPHLADGGYSCGCGTREAFSGREIVKRPLGVVFSRDPSEIADAAERTG